MMKLIKRACSKEQINQRREEILNVVDLMLDNFDYQEISMKTISERISIARSSLYCYYQSKEEIMLDLLKEKYISLFSDLTNLLNKKYETKNELACNLSNCFFNHKKLLRISAMYLNDIEVHASLESVVDFKKIFIKLIPDLKESISNQFENTKKENIDNFYTLIITILHSFYPILFPNSNQEKAMEINNLPLVSDKIAYLTNYLLFVIEKM